MIDDVESIIEELGVVVLVGDLDVPGYYIEDWNAIFIDSGLDEQQHLVVLLHELGHAAKQHGESSIYNATMNAKIKMEYGANRFMIKYLLQRFIAITDIEPHLVNYLDFMRQNDIPSRDEGIVKSVIAGF